ncbi:MAG: hypothetical protein GTO45_16185 [Candidatus Aminicenantes bacterium]|nr:hypothetical protein [Candidatus Aminicenantes bacterium]NIM79554.1 hypothetical protein [Candidatus Aminicenantes bacterium]NIN19665.1 hypothetical protein [Candidatus Aminicenantes bacterium]NIN43547.1 hypothetical protein [Candidatus Aminicenantes bacterium]NIN86292.1 hypothetical protein [Candidatus Aminicenantes bacterium]
MELKTPKELFEIVPGTRLIDFSLRHILAFPRKEKITVAVVIRPWKAEVAEYVAGQLPGIPVETVMFNDDYREWPGSVYSAQEVFSKKNLVLLPDSFLSLSTEVNGMDPITTDFEGKTLVELMENALSEHKVVFGCIECKDNEILKTLGAVRIENALISAFQDKPTHLLADYNGFWGCYGFRNEYGKVLYDYLIHSVHHQALPLTEQPFFPPGVILLGAYYDLGTRENIRRFLHYFVH